MRYLTSVYWERGSVAKENQDSLVLLQALTKRGRVLMASVCDGMGGLAQGETASGYVTKRLQEWFYGPLLRAVHKRKAYWIIRRSLDRLVYDMHERLTDYAKKEKIRTGTTMTVLLIWEKTYLLWHLGDSRGYRLGAISGKKAAGGCIERMTKDHVRGKNLLTKCVGSFPYARPDFKMGTLRSEQAFLLCSDGFRNHIGDSELADVLCPDVIEEEAQAFRRLREIGEACMKRGERDNLSAIYIKALK